MSKSKTLGLANRMLDIHKRAQAMRAKGIRVDFEDAIRGFQLDLAKKDGIKPTERELKYGMELMFAEVGINPDVNTVREVLTLTDFQNFKWAVPEGLLTAINLGVEEEDYTGDFISIDEAKDVSKNDVPLYLRETMAVTEESSDMADMPLETIQLGEKTVAARENKTGFIMSDKTVRRMSINATFLHAQKCTRSLVYKRKRYLLNTLVNGDQISGSDAAVVIGVDNTTNKFKYIDLLRVWVRSGKLGNLMDTLWSDEEKMIQIMYWDEFRNRQSGTPEKTLNLRQKLPTSVNLYPFGVESILDGEKVMLVDPKNALGRWTAKALTLDAERIIRKGAVVTVIDEEYGLYTLLPTARVVADGTKTYSSNKFPDWFDVNRYEQVAA